MEEKQGVLARGFQSASDILIRRGTAMGPLVPALWLVPIFLGSALLSRGSPWISMLLTLPAIAIVVAYLWHYARFAKNDADRLQSEEYRYGMKRMEMIAAKELPYPVPADSLHLPSATSNPIHPLPDLKALQETLRVDEGGGQ